MQLSPVTLRIHTMQFHEWGINFVCSRILRKLYVTTLVRHCYEFLFFLLTQCSSVNAILFVENLQVLCAWHIYLSKPLKKLYTGKGKNWFQPKKTYSIRIVNVVLWSAYCFKILKQLLNRYSLYLYRRKQSFQTQLCLNRYLKYLLQQHFIERPNKRHDTRSIVFE